MKFTKNVQRHSQANARKKHVIFGEILEKFPAKLLDGFPIKIPDKLSK